MNKTKIATAIALCIGTYAGTASAVDINITKMRFNGQFVAQGQTNDATGDLGLFQSVDNFNGFPWAAAGVAYFDGFNGTFVEDTDTATDSGNIVNSTNPNGFGAFTQTVTTNPDGDASTRDFAWSGNTAKGDFFYKFELTENQFALGTLFNWNANTGIPVLAVFDCGSSGTACAGNKDENFIDPAGNLARRIDNTTGAYDLYMLGGAPVATDVNGNPIDGAGAIYPTQGGSILDSSGNKLIEDGFVLNDSDPNHVSNVNGWITLRPVVGMATAPFGQQVARFDGAGSDFAPDTVIDGTSTLVGAPVNIDVLANDIDRDGDMPITSTITITTPPRSGTATAVVNAANDGTIDFTPTGLVADDVDSFDYTVTDTAGNVSNPTTVTVTALGVANTAPVANGFATNTDEDTPLNIAVADTATDGDGDSLEFATFQNPSANNGAVTANGASDTLTYTPFADFNGNDTITYSVTDTKDNSNTETITITVNSVNDVPECLLDASLATASDTTPLTVAGNDLVVDCTDVDGDTVTFAPSSTDNLVNVTISEDGAGNITITPAAGATSGSFTFDATDSNGGTTEVTANVQIGVVFSNFTMLDGGGNTFGGTNDIEFTWDDTFNIDASDKTFGKMTIRSVTPRAFESFFWTADNIRVFGPGTYSFDTTCTTAQYNDTTTDITNCGGPLSPGQSEAERFITVTVPAGHVAAHIIFAWGQPDGGTPCGVQNCDIDVVNVWEVGGVWDRHGAAPGSQLNKLHDGAAGTPPDPATAWELVNIDPLGRGINGIAMVDGPFQGLSPNFNLGPASTTELVTTIEASQGDTDLGGSALAGMSVFGLFASLLALFGLRSTGRKD